MRNSIIIALAAAWLAGCGEHGSSLCTTGQECCRSREDCAQSFEQCFAPGADVGCGACQIPPTTCLQDTECTAQGPEFICATVRCACNGEMACIAGCTS